jgi:hypothetical protein
MNQATIRASIQRKLNIRTRPAQLGDNAGLVRDNRTAGNVWVRLLQADNTLGMAISLPVSRNANLPMTHGTPVRIGTEDGRDVVMGADPVAMASAGTHPAVLNPLDDTMNGYVQTPQFLPLLCKPHGDPAKPLTASVWPAVLDLGNTLALAGAAEIDLSALVPATDEHCYAVVLWRTDTSELEATASTAKTVVDPLTTDDLLEAISLRSAGAIPVWAWRLEGDQTALRAEAGQQQDLRQFINVPQPSLIEQVYAYMAANNAAPLDFLIRSGNLLAFGFFDSHNVNSWKAATNAVYTVPTGKTLVVQQVFCAPEVVSDSANRQVRLYNTTDAAQVVAPATFALPGAMPWFSAGAFSNVAAGKAVRLEIWNADGTTRYTGGLLIACEV